MKKGNVVIAVAMLIIVATGIYLWQKPSQGGTIFSTASTATDATAATDAPKSAKTPPHGKFRIRGANPQKTDHAACLSGTPTAPVSRGITTDVDAFLASIRPGLTACVQSGQCKLHTVMKDGVEYVAIKTYGCTSLPWEPRNTALSANTNGGAK